MKVRFLEPVMLLGTHYDKGEFLDVTNKAIYEDWLKRGMIEPVTAEIERLKAVLADPKIPKYPGEDTKEPEPIPAILTVTSPTGESVQVPYEPKVEPKTEAAPAEPKKSKKRG
jgi:hypothetical protein